MQRHRTERHERNFHERKHHFAHKEAMSYDHDMNRGLKKRYATLNSDEEPTFSPRKKTRYTMELEPHSERHMQTLADKGRPRPWKIPNYPNTSFRERKRILTQVPAYSRISDFSGVLSPQLNPEIARPGPLTNQKEGNAFFTYEYRRQSVDSDGDVLMRDADSEKVVVESAALNELDSRLRELESAKRSWEIEVKEVKAKLSKNVYRLDALEDIAESRHRHSRQRQIERW